jgi:hypothetical protein
MSLHRMNWKGVEEETSCLEFIMCMTAEVHVWREGNCVWSGVSLELGDLNWNFGVKGSDNLTTKVSVISSHPDVSRRSV